MVYSARLQGQRVTFGISGLLYKSNVLLYDRQTGSLWSQITSRAVSGKLAGTELVQLPSVTTTWQSWQALHPKTSVLSDRTGHFRDYEEDPYAGYHKSSSPMFSAGPADTRLRPKEKVFGVHIDGHSRAYPLGSLPPEPGTLQDRIGPTSIQLHWKAGPSALRATTRDGTPLPGMISYWFAWSGFHPETTIHK